MRAVREIVDHHHAVCAGSHGRFPVAVDAVVIDDQPVRHMRGQHVARFFRIMFGRGAQPCGMGRTGCHFSHCFRQGQKPYRETGGFHDGMVAARMFAHDEQDFGVALTKSGCQCQTAHDVTGADLETGVDAYGDIQ
ncbi:MAG: hypothetical protein U5P41_09465 [Gammaproteobacteria bacterium]|nr:hypothetical protein [Gammaproteobacteria bacterium]